METGQNWYRWKATIMENPTPSVARILDQNSRRTSGFTGKQSRGAQIRNIGAFLSWKLLSSSSSSFVVTLPSVLGRFQWCLGCFWSGKPGLGSVLSRGRSVSLWNEFLWLYLAGQRLETEVKGQVLCMLAALIGHFLIFWLESLYVQNLSCFLSKTPPSFAAASQWSQTSPERAFCAILE